MKKTIVWSIGLVLLATQMALAAIPNVINYQGRLTNHSGDPYADGTYAMTITLYNDPVASSPSNVIGSEVHSVDTKNGYFNIQIGAASSPMDLSSFDFNEEYYLGITVNPDTEMTPRKKLTSVGYAFRARNATSADTATSATSATNAGQLDNLDSTDFLRALAGSVTQTNASFAPKVYDSAGSEWVQPKIMVGTGMTNEFGNATITFSNVFTHKPVLIVSRRSLSNGGEAAGYVDDSDDNIAYIHIFNSDGTAGANAGFSWIAIGY
ncbi:hypothetical protein K8S19_05320 [bacterium]|nr:hypothetical protein [bacterium]